MDKARQNGAPASGWRLRLGGAIFVVGFLSPALIPVVVRSPLSTEWKTALSGLLLAGIPELFTIAAVAVMGKPGFDALKQTLASFLRRYGPADEVGRDRYRVGLVMFLVPFGFAFLSHYAGHLIPGYAERPHLFGLTGDIMLVASVFVLGGNFWDKLHALLRHDATAVFAPTTSNEASRA
jgi:hypothetical protein